MLSLLNTTRMSLGQRWLQITAGKTALPNYFRFQSDVPIHPSLDDTKLLEFSRNSSSGSMLATKIFENDKVRSVLLGREMVIVRLAHPSDFKKQADPISDMVKTFLESGEPAVEAQQAPDLRDIVIEAPAPEEGVEQHIAHLQKVLDLTVRPMLQQDRGDIEFNEFVADGTTCEANGYPSGTIYVTLLGACGGCPHSKQTMRDFVTRMVQKYLPNITEVINKAE